MKCRDRYIEWKHRVCWKQKLRLLYFFYQQNNIKKVKKYWESHLQIINFS